jgi:hypothetical protein
MFKKHFQNILTSFECYLTNAACKRRLKSAAAVGLKVRHFFVIYPASLRVSIAPAISSWFVSVFPSILGAIPNRTHQKGSTQTRKGKYLNWNERIQIETLLREGFPEEVIGERLGRSARTITREFERGWVYPPHGAIQRRGALTALRAYSPSRIHNSKPEKTEASSESLFFYIIACLLIPYWSSAVFW